MILLYNSCFSETRGAVQNVQASSVWRQNAIICRKSCSNLIMAGIICKFTFKQYASAPGVF